jgi:hypothetical protein
MTQHPFVLVKFAIGQINRQTKQIKLAYVSKVFSLQSSVPEFLVQYYFIQIYSILIVYSVSERLRSSWKAWLKSKLLVEHVICLVLV